MDRHLVVPPGRWRNRRPSARRYLHAATYYAAPLALIAHTHGSVTEARAVAAASAVCWERAVELARRRPGPRSRTRTRPCLGHSFCGRRSRARSW